MTNIDVPWLTVKSVCRAYGVNFATAKKNILAGTFPVPTYKVGKLLVVDKEVHAEFFRKHRDAGLSSLKITTKG